MSLFHRWVLRSHGLTDVQLGALEKAGFNWQSILALIIADLPALIAFIESLLNPPAPKAA